MILTFDIGNTRIKWAQFEEAHLVKSGVIASAQRDVAGWGTLPFSADVISSSMAAVSGQVPAWLQDVPRLTVSTPLPIGVDYNSRATLGADRLAAAVGAFSLLPKGTPALIIDAGTCITVDYLSPDGVYQGGAILPGITMQLQALHEHTAALPLIPAERCDAWDGSRVGKNTADSILAGVLTATRFAVAQFVDCQRQQTPNLHVFVTGGDAARVAPAQAIWELNLLHHGLFAIYNHVNSHK